MKLSGQEYHSGWVAIPFSKGYSQSRDQTQVSPAVRQILRCLSPQERPGHPVSAVLNCCSHVLVTPRTAACQVPLSMGFSMEEYWNGEKKEYCNGLPFSSSGDLPNAGIQGSWVLYMFAGGFFTTLPHGKPPKKPPTFV